MRVRPYISLIVVILLLFNPPQTHSLPLTTLTTLHSLFLRVSSLRLSRGDKPGSDRATFIANKLDHATSLGLWRTLLSLGWDYVRNYAWRDGMEVSEVFGVVKDLNELIGAVTEVMRFRSEGERADWVAKNYRGVLKACNSLFRRLLRVFHRSGPLRQLVETVQKEVIEGDLLRDCLELGSNDLNGLIQIMKDVAMQFSSNSDMNDL